MTRVTNLVKRKRKYVSDDTPMVDRDSGEPSSSKRLKLEAGQILSTSAFSKNARKGGKVVKGLEGTRGDDGNLMFDNDADTDASLLADRAVASEKRRRRRVEERMAVKTCFACRGSGHTAKECPTAVGEGRSTVGICYKYATLGFSRSAIQIAYSWFCAIRKMRFEETHSFSLQKARRRIQLPSIRAMFCVFTKGPSFRVLSEQRQGFVP